MSEGVRDNGQVGTNTIRLGGVLGEETRYVVGKGEMMVVWEREREEDSINVIGVLEAAAMPCRAR